MKISQIATRIGGTIHKTVKKFDLFSKNIMFTYKGDTSFSTFLGGFVSIIIFSIIFVYSAFLFQVMVNRENSNSSKSTEVIDLTVHDEDYYEYENS